MSTEDKANEISAEAQDQASLTHPTTPQQTEPGRGAGGPITLFFMLGLVASLVNSACTATDV